MCLGVNEATRGHQCKETALSLARDKRHERDDIIIVVSRRLSPFRLDPETSDPSFSRRVAPVAKKQTACKLTPSFVVSPPPGL